MTPRQRIEAALRREKTDRVPVFLRDLLPRSDGRRTAQEAIRRILQGYRRAMRLLTVKPFHLC